MPPVVFLSEILLSYICVRDWNVTWISERGTEVWIAYWFIGWSKLLRIELVKHNCWEGEFVNILEWFHYYRWNYSVHSGVYLYGKLYNEMTCFVIMRLFRRIFLICWRWQGNLTTWFVFGTGLNNGTTDHSNNGGLLLYNLYMRMKPSNYVITNTFLIFFYMIKLILLLPNQSSNYVSRWVNPSKLNNEHTQTPPKRFTNTFT